MAKRPYRWKWTATIDPESLPLLQELAKSLGFVVGAPGSYQGHPSPAAMLDALASAYESDPDGVQLVFRSIGVHNSPDALVPFEA